MARYDPEIEEEATTDVPRTKLSSIDLYQQGLLKNRVDIIGKGSFIFVLCYLRGDSKITGLASELITRVVGQLE